MLPSRPFKNLALLVLKSITSLGTGSVWIPRRLYSVCVTRQIAIYSWKSTRRQRNLRHVLTEAAGTAANREKHSDESKIKGARSLWFPASSTYWRRQDDKWRTQLNTHTQILVLNLLFSGSLQSHWHKLELVFFYFQRDAFNEKQPAGRFVTQNDLCDAVTRRLATCMNTTHSAGGVKSWVPQLWG